MTEEQLSKIIGRNFYDVFKPWTPEELKRIKEEILDNLSRELRELDEVELHDMFSDNNCQVIMSQHDKEYRERGLNGYTDEDDEDSWDDEYYDDYQFVSDNAYGYIVNTNFSEFLIEIAGEDKCIILDENFDYVSDSLYDDAWVMDEFENPDNCYILVTLGKKFNVVDFGSGKYVFSEWLSIAPVIITADEKTRYFIVDHVNTKQIFDSNGKSIGPECDDIKLYCNGATAFITINKLTNYMNWLTGDIYIRDIKRHKNVRELESIMTADEKSYLYGPDDVYAGFNKRLVKLCNLELVAMGALNGFRSVPNLRGYGYAVTTKKFGPCVVDTKNRVTYNAEGEIVDRCTEDY